MSTPSAGAVFDPDIDRWLRARARDRTATDTSIDGTRRHSRSVNDLARARLVAPPTLADEADVLLETGAGPLAVRVFRPAPSPSGPSGSTIVYFHGGGWIAGGVETHLHHARRLCVESGAVVVSVDYRLAPEHAFPAAFDDCLSATRWARAGAVDLGGDARRLIVGGDSAGAQLAASVAISARDAGLELAAQLLIVPVVDSRGGYRDAARNAQYPSRIENDSDFGLTLAAMAGFVQLYAPGVDDWRLSPLLAPDLSGVAPAVVYTAGFDVLRDEGRHYVSLLRAAGVPVRHRNWPSLNHGYFGLGGVSAVADAAAAHAGSDLREISG